jgi:outer membrane lipoprotein SlyB
MDVQDKQNLDKAGEQGQQIEVSGAQNEQSDKHKSLSTVAGGLIGAAVGGLTGGRIGAVFGAAVGAVAAKVLKGEDPVEQAQGAVEGIKERAAEFTEQAKERVAVFTEQAKESIEAAKEAKHAGDNSSNSGPTGEHSEPEAATTRSEGGQNEQQKSEPHQGDTADMDSMVKAAYDRAVELQKPAENQAPVQ